MPEGAHLANKQRPEQRTKRTTAHDEEKLFFSDERIRKTKEKLFCGHGQHPSSGWNLRNRTRREKNDNNGSAYVFLLQAWITGAHPLVLNLNLIPFSASSPPLPMLLSALLTFEG